MADLRPIITTILLLVVVVGLFYWSYSEYSVAGQINFMSALAAAGGVAVLLSVLKVWNPNIVSRATGTSIDDTPLSVDTRKFYRADDSSSLHRKRWWRE